MKRVTLLAAALSAVLLLLVLGSTAPAADAPATVKLLHEDLVLVLTFDSGQTLKVTAKGVRLRAGTHSVKSFSFYKKDEKGRVWELRSVANLGLLTAITVASGQEKILDGGPPVEFHYWSKQGEGDQADTVTTEVSAVGRYNEAYFPGAYLDGKKPAPPSFRAVSTDGDVLYTGRLDYRAEDCCRGTWKLPRGFKGKYKLEFKPVMGPFEWAAAEKEFEVK